jgi:hypothetical protein
MVLYQRKELIMGSMAKVFYEGKENPLDKVAEVCSKVWITYDCENEISPGVPDPVPSHVMVGILDTALTLNLNRKTGDDVYSYGLTMSTGGGGTALLDNEKLTLLQDVLFILDHVGDGDLLISSQLVQSADAQKIDGPLLYGEIRDMVEEFLKCGRGAVTAGQLDLNIRAGMLKVDNFVNHVGLAFTSHLAEMYGLGEEDTDG